MALNTVQKIKAMSKMSKIDKVHIRFVMQCMSKMGKEHTHTFWLITSLILNGFSIPKKFWKAETQILYILKHVGDVGDRSSTPKGCNAIYVGDIGDHNNHQILCILKIITIFELKLLRIRQQLNLL